MTYHPKGWKKQRIPGYVKSHDAVKNGSNRSQQKVEPLSDEQWIQKGWKPAPGQNELPEQVEVFVNELKKASGGTVYLPATINSDGSVQNIRQFTTEAQGPDQGHWSTVNGKRRWFKGQHNYVRQQNPRTHEPVTESKVMNRNTKLEELGDKKQNPVTCKKYTVPSKIIEPEARLSRFGRVVHVKKAPAWDGMTAKAVERAANRIEKGTAKFLAVSETNENSAPVNSIERQVQGGASITNDSVGSEAHVTENGRRE